MTLRSLRLLAAVLFAICVVATPVFAQQYTGRIDVTLVDATGARLPGVVVDIVGPLNQTMTSDSRGEAHFLNLTVGTYQVKATMQGFNEYRNANVPVVAGGSVPLEIKLTVAGTQETVQVTAESPVIDTKKQGTATAVTLDELQNIPTARDPWVVLQSVPGIVMDRVNVGGSESGQQSGFVGKGADSGQTTWNVDGMPITDMSSLSSPFYFDFDNFAEMSVTTGGADTKSATGGIQLNMMLKSGTNIFHGNAKSYIEDPQKVGWSQSNNMDPALATALGSKTGQGDRTAMFSDLGGDLGGPILKDRLWFWGAYGHQDVRIIKINGTTDRTVMKNDSLKIQGQLNRDIRGSFTYFHADKLKWGRNAGATRTQLSTYDQTGPNDMYKGEMNFVFGNNLFLVGRYAHVKGGFGLFAEGGSNPAWLDQNGVWQNGYDTYVTDRPQDSVIVDGNYFKGNHEFKFGFSWRTSDVHSTDTWGSDIITDTYDNWGYPLFLPDGSEAAGYPYMDANVQAPGASDGNAKYTSFYAGDTITLQRATINLGIRYDHQAASVLPTSLAAPQGAGLDALLPSITAPGVANALTYNAVQPRVGLTYALDEAHKTQLRASYAMFTNQIGTGAATFMSVAQYRGFYVTALDKNGDHIAQASELLLGAYPYFVADGDYYGYDPANPGNVASSINKVGSYSTPLTHEVIVGLDHELMPNFGVSASFTWRRMINFNWRPRICPSCANGYIDGSYYTLQGDVAGTLPSGVPGSPDGSYSVPYYAPTAGVDYAAAGGLYSTHPDYHQSYKGFEITATKRMSNRWMARFGFSTNSWREYFDSAMGQGDPTPTLSSPNINGGIVASAAGGSGKSSIYMTDPKYQFMANGAYQLPYDIDLGANYILRQGFPMPWNYSTSGGFKDPLNGSSKRLLLPSQYDWARLPKISEVDFRIGKRVRFAKTAALNVNFDIFNLFNAATVLGREYRKNYGAYTDVAEIMQPRIMRLGLRITF